MAKRKASTTKIKELILMLKELNVKEFQDGDLKIALYYEEKEKEFKEQETAESQFNKKYLTLAKLGEEADV